MIDKANLKDIYPLSPMQEGMLFHALYDKDSSAYIEQLSYRMAGDLDVGLFHRSWDELFQRHDILRTVFVHEKTSRPLQVVLKHSQVSFYFEDLRSKSPDQREERLAEYRLRERGRSFDLAQDVLLRVAVFQLEKDRYEVIRTHHHVLMDAWSSGILLKELLEIYQALREGHSPCLPEVVSYSKYIQWLEGRESDVSERYWSTYLEGYDGVATIPPLRFYEGDMGYEPAELAFDLDVKQTRQLEDLAVRYQATMSTMIKTVWGVLLGRYNNKRDVVFGSVVSGRPPQVIGVDQMVGLFINSVPVRVRSAPDDTFAGLLQRVQKESLEAGEHLYLPLAIIQGNRGLVDHLVAFENYPLDRQLQAAMDSHAYGLKLEQISKFGHTHYNFSLAVNPGTRLQVILMFNMRVYLREQMQRMAEHFRKIIDAILACPTTLIEDIDILPPEELRQITVAFNNTKAEYPDDRTIDSLFEEQSTANSDRVAIIWQDKTISYRELSEKANRTAHYLSERCNVQVEDRVAVILERSDWLVISLLGILKAGGVYVPIDPAYPKERIEFMLADSGCKVVLTDGEHLSLIPAGPAAVDIEMLGKHSVENSLPVTSSHNLAYVIYTSGSTGYPKGVMIEHRGFINLCMEHGEDGLEVKQNDRVLQFASPSFDASLWEIFMALLRGATLVIATREIIKGPQVFTHFLNKHRVTVATLPPSYLSTLQPSSLNTLRILITAGESARVEDALRYSRQLTFFNAYGPSETSVCATYYKANPEISYAGRIPIGKPIRNTSIYILDMNNRPAPIGIPGEICISGLGLARGYLNNDELTTRSFVPNPFMSGERIYRTGDLGLWRADGNIDFLGRLDDQVKIRGFRVEIGEIETVLDKHPEVEDTVVIAWGDHLEDKRLVAYVVANRGSRLTNSELRDYLKRKLPEYMIPSVFVMIESLPLTPSGKVDRRALPTPEASGGNLKEGHVAPGTQTETILAEIWTGILKLNRIDIYDNFFEIGGHSLSATRVMSQVRSKFQVEIPLRTLFENPTIAELACIIDRTKEDVAQPKLPAIKRVPREKRRVDP